MKMTEEKFALEKLKAALSEQDGERAQILSRLERLTETAVEPQLASILSSLDDLVAKTANDRAELQTLKDAVAERDAYAVRFEDQARMVDRSERALQAGRLHRREMERLLRAAEQSGAGRASLLGWTRLLKMRRDLGAELAATRRAGQALLPATIRVGPNGKHRRSTLASFAAASAKRVPCERQARARDALRYLFHTAFYLERNAIKLSPGQSAFDHYLRFGQAAELSPHPLIDLASIRAGSFLESPFDLVTYAADTSQFRLNPHPLFDGASYIDRNPDVAAAGINPLVHYLKHGWREGRAPNALFDDLRYLRANPDVAAAGWQPLLHYAMLGCRENRSIHPLFDPAFYLERNLDVKAAGIDPLAHFLAYGRHEGRSPSAKIDSLARQLSPLGIARTLETVLDSRPELDEMLEPPAELGLDTDGAWPPKPLHDYWLPQRLSDLIVERYGEDEVALHIYLFSIVDRYAGDPAQFEIGAEFPQLLDRITKLARLRSQAEPTVSIVIPVYNNLIYTLTAMLSILEAPTLEDYEIIVADDVSTDGTAMAVASIGGLVRHMRNETNLGFLHNCNAAAKLARGAFIVFLNNDTITLPGWLDNLIEPMRADARIGFTGSKLLNGDGTLQEAGGIVWQDGSAWNFGRNQDAFLPEFNYLKDVDYVSGASIAVRRSLWEQLGGFDPQFAPAYCEDTDLAFRIRDAGFRTVYSPHSALVHHEGRTHGRDTGAGIKAYQIINQEKFKKRWRDTLLREHFRNAENVFLARDRSRDKPHILIVDHYVPQWDQDAGSRTCYNYIKFFIDQEFSVTFWSNNLHEDRKYSEPLQDIGVEVIYGSSYAGRFQDFIKNNGRYFQYSYLNRPHISIKYIDMIRNNCAAFICYYGHDVHFKRLDHQFKLDNDLATFEEMKRFKEMEIEIFSKSDFIYYPSHEEIEFLQDHITDDRIFRAIPMAIFDAEELKRGASALSRIEDRDAYHLLFVGGFSHAPNLDGILWFLHEVMPRLEAADHRFRLSIVGSRTPRELLAKATDRIKVLGRISDDELDRLYDTVGMSVVPLRYGGGVKGKVIEAMARGVPVAMTSVGAQGIRAAQLMAVLTDDPLEFAEGIIEAARDRSLTLTRATAALDFIRQNYSKEAVKAILGSDIVELAPRAFFSGSAP